MKNLDEVMQVILIGLIFAGFLLITCRFLKAIELCKECLFFLNDTAGIIYEKFYKLFSKKIYFIIWKTSSLISDNTNAMDYAEKLLKICGETGERHEEYSLSKVLAERYFHQSKYAKAKQLSEKMLLISKEIGDRNKEANCYVILGAVYGNIGQYEKARDLHEKSLAIHKEIGDRNGQAVSYGNLGNVYQAVDEYEKARDHLEKSLAIQKEIGDRNGEAASYGNLGNVYRAVGEYEKARDHIEKSLAIQKEIGNRQGEAAAYSSLAVICQSVGEYEKALHYLENQLAISKSITNKHQIASSYYRLGINFLCLGKYNKANEHIQKALVIFAEIGDRGGVAACYNVQGAILMSIRNVIPAKECLQKALATSKELGNKKSEAGGCLNYGILLFNEAEYVRGEEYIMNGLVLSELTGDIAVEYRSLQVMAHLRLKEGKIQEAISYFLSGIEKCEKMRGSLHDNDQFKISFLDLKITSYRELSSLLWNIGCATEALYVSELSKARALADLMSARYSMEKKISTNPGSLAGIQSIVAKECNRTCLYVSYYSENIYLWILKASGVQHVHTINGNDLIANEGLGQQLEEFFKFRSFGILPEELCEDRSLHRFYPEFKSREEENYERIGKESEANQGPKMNLPICYKLFIAPVACFLEGLKSPLFLIALYTKSHLPR